MPVGRFAPSPTGRLHIGNLRTALVAWLFARSDGSRFWLRFEDLDTQAVRAEHYRTQIDDLVALGLDWDEPVIKQSDRLDFYRQTLDGLLAGDQVYPCYCSRREIREAASAPNSPTGLSYPGTCARLTTGQRATKAAKRPPAYRIRASGRVSTFVDELAGPQRFELDDFVVQRNDGTPAYHLVVVLDDDAAGVELVVRGDDLLESAGRQLLLYELLGLAKPRYAHVPLVLAPDRDRLAKRHGSVTLADRQRSGQSADRLLVDLAISLNLAEPGESVTVADLLPRFEPEPLPRQPWVLDARYLQGLRINSYE